MKNYTINLLGSIVWGASVMMVFALASVFEAAATPIISQEITMATVNGSAGSYAIQRAWYLFNGVSHVATGAYALLSLYPLCIRKTK